jgi:hypothetical protein
MISSLHWTDMFVIIKLNITYIKKVHYSPCCSASVPWGTSKKKRSSGREREKTNRYPHNGSAGNFMRNAEKSIPLAAVVVERESSVAFEPHPYHARGQGLKLTCLLIRRQSNKLFWSAASVPPKFPLISTLVITRTLIHQAWAFKSASLHAASNNPVFFS